MPLDSIASHSGAKSGDYLVKIGGSDVFQLNHEEAKEMVRKAGNQLSLVVERGEKIVPSMNTAFPKPKEETVEKPKSYSQVVFVDKQTSKDNLVHRRCWRGQADCQDRRSKGSPR